MRRTAVLVCWLLLSALGLLQAQTAPQDSLERVQSHLDAHRYADARLELSSWWQSAGERAGGELLARAIYLRAVLTENLDEAECDLLRTAIEHPQSAFADAALFRLAQLHLARGDREASALFLQRLLNDYPQSTLRPAALAALGSSGAAAPTPPVPPAGPPTFGGSAASAGAPVATAPNARFTVQVGSFTRAAHAESLRAGLVAQGFEAYIGPSQRANLVTVRVGVLPDRSTAESTARNLRAAGYQTWIVPFAD